MAFIPNHENKATVNHKDGNPSNNKLKNLEWSTHKENVIHSFKILGKKANKTFGRIGILAHDAKPVVVKTLSDKLIGVYGSAAEAAKSLKINSSNITYAIKYGSHISQGRKFYYISKEEYFENNK